ncbi:hypothetical protein NEOLEDRAFT_45328 [Neolentinus lepideus HHB14362 ss-1]|uniref:Arrestin C-terminal-like domain-containing protein n=1 Tax=Neolentinus lepideus HHB14362 ss-1 TaxID=1314782 RepID=A0A165WAK1_9AGAM|nr:hypothetical protein NEOLEDRAFT_45328 [Neolentinus lepideus HHB14362 ss-1]
MSTSSTSRGSTGLGFDLDVIRPDVTEVPPSDASSVVTSQPARPSTVRFRSNQANTEQKNESSDVNNCNSGFSAGARQDASTLGLRSIRGMQGLLLAEVGASTVEFDIHSDGPAFKEGHLIAPQILTPGGGTRVQRSRHMSLNEGRLNRQPTLLSVGCSSARNATELKALLGNSSTKLKAKAKILPPHGSAGEMRRISLEQAKSRARVELDLVLSNNTCVQGGVLKGQVNLRIRKRLKKEAGLRLSDAKLRVVGFEGIPNGGARHVFYQHTAPLEAVSATLASIYASPPDLQGYAEVKEGTHHIPFAMELPTENSYGHAKGILTLPSGVVVRYIVMVSARLRDPGSGKQSIAHFYRQCEVWPRLEPSLILLPAHRPIQNTTTVPLFMGGARRVKLTAYLYRLHWVAGQRCYVALNISNDTKKTIRSVTLTLIRTTIVFKPKPVLNANPRDEDPDACQTSTSRKEVATSTLEMGQKSTKGHASAKGWWTGVGPDSEVELQHFIQIPPDALSVARGRLLEVEYTLCVSASAGSLTSDIQVLLPLRIVNFMSIDPLAIAASWSMAPRSVPISSRQVSALRLPQDSTIGPRADVPSRIDRDPVVRNAEPQPCPVMVDHQPSHASAGASSDTSPLQNPHSLVTTRNNTEDGVLAQDELSDPEEVLDDMDQDPESLMAQMEAELENMSPFQCEDGGGDMEDDAVLQYVVGSARLDDNDGHFDPICSDSQNVEHSLAPKSLSIERLRELSEREGTTSISGTEEKVYPVTRNRSKTVSDIHRPAYGTRTPASFKERVQARLVAESLNATSATESATRHLPLLSSHLPCLVSTASFASAASRCSEGPEDRITQQYPDVAHPRSFSSGGDTEGLDLHPYRRREPNRSETCRGSTIIASQMTPALNDLRHTSGQEDSITVVDRIKEPGRSIVIPARGSSVRARIAELERRVQEC